MSGISKAVFLALGFFLYSLSAYAEEVPPPVSEAVPSGGLGLSRDAWEILHGKPDSCMEMRLVNYAAGTLCLYAEGRYQVSFEDGRVVALNTALPYAPLVLQAGIDAMQAAGTELIPPDSVFKSRSCPSRGTPTAEQALYVDTYHSPSLTTHFAEGHAGKAGYFLMEYAIDKVRDIRIIDIRFPEWSTTSGKPCQAVPDN